MRDFFYLVLTFIPMRNYEIAEKLALLGTLLEIHGDNSYRAKSYAIAAFTLEKLEVEVTELPEAEIFNLKNIGEVMGKKILSLIHTGQLDALNKIVAKTPPGVIQMLEIKGLGPKKIHSLWKEMGIDSLELLEAACLNNIVASVKGFGAKTQSTILASIQFYLSNQNKWLYSQLNEVAIAMDAAIQSAFPKETSLLTGQYRRQLEVLDKLEWTTTASPSMLEKISSDSLILQRSEPELTVFSSPQNQSFYFYHVATENLWTKVFETSCSPAFLAAWNENYGLNENYGSEEEIFSKNKLSFIPPALRESAAVLQQAAKHSLPNLLQPNDIRGLIHAHSKWSDGIESIETMAEACIARELEYMLISDHSKTAAYANGLTEARIVEQHEQIDVLNKKYHPFKIFKGIESDILGDGSLDYDSEVLASFDVVIASVHSNLSMEKAKAMKRLIAAIENPFTSILGHMTGRLLLKRSGLDVDHVKLIDAAAANNVVIEINANPRRLDMDWRWIDYALEKGVLLSINPDAHAIAEIDYTKFGVLVAQKGGLTKNSNLSSFHLPAFERFVEEQRTKR